MGEKGKGEKRRLHTWRGPQRSDRMDSSRPLRPTKLGVATAILWSLAVNAAGHRPPPQAFQPPNAKGHEGLREATSIAGLSGLA